MSLFAGGEENSGYDPKSSLDALALRKRADIEFHKRNFSEAEFLLSLVQVQHAFLFITFLMEINLELERD